MLPEGVFPSKTAANAHPGLPEPGETFAGKYLIVRVLGEGGMGIVYEAVHRRLDVKVAIKTLLPAVMGQPDLVARFEREGRAAARLRNRHVAHTLDVDESEEGLPYMVMEYLEGVDLDLDLQRRGRLPIEESVDYVLQACEAMDEAHGLGIIHRDLKPANFFVCTVNGERVLKVLDFGISKTEDERGRRLTNTEVTLGTPVYMSPEQVRGTRDLDHRSDIWSLGVILYELLAGEPPFGGSATAAAVAIATDPIPPLSLKRPDVPAGLEAAIERALSKEPQDRFDDVASFAAALAPFAPHRGAWPSNPDLHVSASLDLGRSVLSSGHDLSEWSPATERAETLSAAALRSAETLPAPSFLPRIRVRTLALAASGALILGLGVRASVHSSRRGTEPNVAAASVSAVTDIAPGSILTATQPSAASNEAIMADTRRIEATDPVPPPAAMKHAPPVRSATATATAMASVPAPTPAAAPPLPKVRPRPSASASLNHPLYIP
jgi:serine/threonine protein kinase